MGKNLKIYARCYLDFLPVGTLGRSSWDFCFILALWLNFFFFFLSLKQKRNLKNTLNSMLCLHILFCWDWMFDRIFLDWSYFLSTAVHCDDCENSNLCAQIILVIPLFTSHFDKTFLQFLLFQVNALSVTAYIGPISSNHTMTISSNPISSCPLSILIMMPMFGTGKY